MRNILPKCILTLTILQLYVSSVAAETPRTIKFQNEEYNENVQVSGQVRSGVMYESDKDEKITLPPDHLYLYLGNGGFDTICGKLISSDGQYEADFRTTELSKDEGKVAIKFESKFKKHINNKYNAKDLTVLAYKGSKNCKRIDSILPTAWTDKVGDTLVVYLNSGQFNTDLILYNKSARKPTKVKCEKINHTKNIAYDTVCSIDLNKQYILSKTKIRRTNGDSRVKPIKLPILSAY